MAGGMYLAVEKTINCKPEYVHVPVLFFEPEE